MNLEKKKKTAKILSDMIVDLDLNLDDRISIFLSAYLACLAEGNIPLEYGLLMMTGTVTAYAEKLKKKVRKKRMRKK